MSFSRFSAARVGALAMSAALCALPPAARALDRADANFDLYYKVYVGGFHVIDLDVGVDYGRQDYDVSANLRTVGTIGSLFPWRMKAFSRGAIVDGLVAPAAAGHRSSWRGDDRYIEMSFSDGLARVSRIKPAPDADARDRVPRELRTGVFDLASAILRAIRAMAGNGDCVGRIPVFDGRRRYDFVLEPRGRETLRASSYSPFSGDTRTCSASIDPKAGFRRHDDSDGDEGRRDTSARVWMGRAFANLPPLPVRITMDTRFGGLRAHLNRATATAAGRRLKLGTGQKAEIPPKPTETRP